MKIYKLTLSIYNYWFTADRDGVSKIAKYFTTYEKAKNYVETYNKNPWVYGREGKITIEPKKEDYRFIEASIDNIEEIEVE